ncbi:hypothetical protein ACVC7V_21220 [Hydrogenophaga sp. A37]|uniref:hypothetical protein n=1 Tax=Hydrogenophaga sp. A37 TaxID=1945864 RepID=UPI00098774E6|nr:hypothetical protein [Hydrogenophaga sp. A37]OOG81558.1 hypothetical protein B0E41_17530 [Hydrogenophaga sp. A37]
MPIPSHTHPCWSRAASGGLARIQTTNLAMQLLAKRIERSTDPVSQKAGEILAFFTKWERILASEVDQISRI